MGGDGESLLACCCMERYHWQPSRTLALPQREKAFVLAALLLKSEHARNKEK